MANQVGKDLDDIDEFLGHSTGGKSTGVLNWRKRGEVLVVLHTRGGIKALWNHPWRRVVTYRDKESREERSAVWGSRINCVDSEGVLKRQHFRDDDGERKYPPEIDPMAKLIEHVRLLIRKREIKFTDPVFEFVADEDTEDGIVTIHAGGLYNHFGRKDLTREELREMKAAGISPKKAWIENAQARCEYVFRVVDLKDVDAGCQVSIEKTALGQKMQKVIRDERRRSGENEGNPLVNPYAFLWEFDESKDFDDKYNVIAMPKEEITDEVLELITETDPPDISDLCRVPNYAQLRAELEATCLIADRIPWDEIFEEAEKRYPSSESEGEVESKSKTERRPASKEETKTERRETKAEERRESTSKPKGETVPDGEFECDACNKPIGPTDIVCAHCSAVYDPEDSSLRGRPCAKCKSVVPLTEVVEGETAECADCGAVHDVVTWEVKAPARERRSRSQARDSKSRG